MKNCKVLVPFVNCDNGVALDVNKIVELNEERASELEGKGLVEIITNPLISNELSDSLTPESENDIESQTTNDDVPPENNDEDNEEEKNNPDKEQDDSDDVEQDSPDKEQVITEEKNKNKKNKK